MRADTLALVGVTASGKTRIACDLAPVLNAEVVCADSMTVYRGMDVGTAKPTMEERARVPHHLLDVADPTEAFTVARFQALAREAIAGLRARGKAPLIVGGSGLYFRSIVDDLAFPPHDSRVRARLEAEDLGALAERLQRVDPAAAVDPANRRRVVRALEVMEVTGRPFSTFRDAWRRYDDVIVAGLDVTPAVLDERIRARLLGMLDAGFLGEVRRLVAGGYRDALTASQAIAYREGLALVDGAITVEEFVDRSARATRRFARRQRSWFRADPRVQWFAADDVGRAREEIRAYYLRRREEQGCGS